MFARLFFAFALLSSVVYSQTAPVSRTAADTAFAPIGIVGKVVCIATYDKNQPDALVFPVESDSGKIIYACKIISPMNITLDCLRVLLSPGKAIYIHGHFDARHEYVIIDSMEYNWKKFPLNK